MDREAALEPGLAKLLAVALAEPELPLAIQLRLPYICNPPGSGPQPRLLWGMWRIGRPLLGDDGRGWSFSTFEEPLGDVRSRTAAGHRLPAGPAAPPPARQSRAQERRVSPYNAGRSRRRQAAIRRWPPGWSRSTGSEAVTSWAGCSRSADRVRHTACALMRSTSSCGAGIGRPRRQRRRWSRTRTKPRNPASTASSTSRTYRRKQGSANATTSRCSTSRNKGRGTNPARRSRRRNRSRRRRPSLATRGDGTGE